MFQLNFKSFEMLYRYLDLSDKVGQDDGPACGLRQLVHQLSRSVVSVEALDVVAPDHALGAAPRDVDLSVAHLHCGAAFLEF